MENTPLFSIPLHSIVSKTILPEPYFGLEKGQLNTVLFTHNIKSINMAELKISQLIDGFVAPLDKDGNPALVEGGSINYGSSNPDVVTLDEDPENEARFVINPHTTGAAICFVEADADLGEGIKTIRQEFAVQVWPEEATGFGIQFGTPRPKVPEVPVPEPVN